jgi:hypothetical protein
MNIKPHAHQPGAVSFAYARLNHAVSESQLHFNVPISIEGPAPLFSFPQSVLCFTPRLAVRSFTMCVLWTSLFLSSFLLLINFCEAGVNPYITTNIDVTTECKTCPRSLCPNENFYGYYGGLDGPLNVTCYTYGTKIIGDNLWLKTDVGCYVTQYDLNEYDGDCKSPQPVVHTCPELELRSMV